MASKLNTKRRQRRQRIRALAQLGREAQAKINAMSARVDASEGEVEEMAAEQGTLQQQKQRLAADNETMRTQLAQLESRANALAQDNATQSLVIEGQDAKIKELTQAVADLTKSIDGNRENEAHRVKAMATALVRSYQPCFRKRMLAKNGEIDRLRRELMVANSLRNIREEASVVQSIRLRDQVIVGMYSALQWCEQRPEFKDGDSKAAWDTRIAPVMDKLKKMIQMGGGPKQQTQSQTQDAQEAPTG